MSIKNIFILILLAIISSCKKDYTCACTNTNGTYDAGGITTTKSSAKKYCEGLSSGDTKCAVK